MRKITLLLTLVIICLCSSCTHYIYNVSSLKANYNSRMTSPEDLEIKSKVMIYTSENYIKGDYELLSFNYWMPWPRLLPFAKPWVKRTSKRFYQKATQIAYQEGGNAIIITSPLNYKVIRLFNFDEESVEIEQFRSYIFETKTMDLFKSGTVAKMARAERKKSHDTYEGEIEANVSNLQYLPEILMAREKINVYNNYNNSLKHSKRSIEKFTKKQTKKLNAKEKKIKKMIAKNKVDSMFMVNSAICEQQWQAYLKGEKDVVIPKQNISTSKEASKSSTSQITKEKEITPSSTETPAKESQPQVQSQVQQKPSSPQPTEKKEAKVISSEVNTEVDNIIYTKELSQQVREGKYIKSFDLNNDGNIDSKELDLIDTLAEQGDVDKNGELDSRETQSFRNRLRQALKYY